MNVGKRDVKKGAIEEVELLAFKRRTAPGDRLKCYRPRRKGDDEIILEHMEVVQVFPFIVRLLYRGESGRFFKTSMTWADAIILNRMTQNELSEEVAKMQKEKGLPYYRSPASEGPKMDKRQRNAIIVSLRNQGRSYVYIANAVGLHSSSVRVIYRKEMAQK